MAAGHLQAEGGRYPRFDPQAHERGHELLGWERLEPFVLRPERRMCGAPVPVAGPGWFKQSQAQQPLRMTSRECQRGCAASGVAHEVECSPTPGVGVTQYTTDFGVQTVLRGGLWRCVQFQLLGHRVDVILENREERAVGKPRGKHTPGKQDHPNRLHSNTVAP